MGLIRNDSLISKIYLAFNCIGVWDKIAFDYEFMVYTRELFYLALAFAVDFFGRPGFFFGVFFSTALVDLAFGFFVILPCFLGGSSRAASFSDLPRFFDSSSS